MKPPITLDYSRAETEREAARGQLKDYGNVAFSPATCARIERALYWLFLVAAVLGVIVVLSAVLAAGCTC